MKVAVRRAARRKRVRVAWVMADGVEVCCGDGCAVGRGRCLKEGYMAE